MPHIFCVRLKVEGEISAAPALVPVVKASVRGGRRAEDKDHQQQLTLSADTQIIVGYEKKPRDGGAYEFSPIKYEEKLLVVLNIKRSVKM